MKRRRNSKRIRQRKTMSKAQRRAILKPYIAELERAKVPTTTIEAATTIRSATMSDREQQMASRDNDSEVCWGVRGPFDPGLDVAFGPFPHEGEARAYVGSERFADFDINPADTWVERYYGTSPVHVRCEAWDFTRDVLPRWRDPDTGKLGPPRLGGK